MQFTEEEKKINSEMSNERKKVEMENSLFLLNTEISEDGRERFRNPKNFKPFTVEETQRIGEKLKELGIFKPEDEENLANGEQLMGIAIMPGQTQVIWMKKI